MKLRIMTLAAALLIAASNANALFVTCTKKYVPHTGQSTLVATLRWSNFEETYYPIGYHFTAVEDPDNWDPSIGYWLFFPDIPGNKNEQILYWVTVGYHTMVSSATSFGFISPPPQLVENPEPDECGPYTRWLS
ncbi:MAG: hypothetical protein OXJ53_19795 [Gammaproteobacteria bacterium]|nr:hypothetical protein [Gammaproteobacteria bacterium]MDE0270968.1 hypothetical protein [Gammaproteobacteria bacterium]